MKPAARAECQACIPDSVEQCLTCMDKYAAALEKELEAFRQGGICKSCPLYNHNPAIDAYDRCPERVLERIAKTLPGMACAVYIMKCPAYLPAVADARKEGNREETADDSNDANA